MYVDLHRDKFLTCCLGYFSKRENATKLVREKVSKHVGSACEPVVKVDFGEALLIQVSSVLRDFYHGLPCVGGCGSNESYAFMSIQVILGE